MTFETAMVLTQEQWDDLADICRQYLRTTDWVRHPRMDDKPDDLNRVRRCRALAERIKDASAA